MITEARYFSLQMKADEVKDSSNKEQVIVA